jgi:hypothetical protein
MFIRDRYFAARAAALGYAKAAMYLGETYARGTHVTQDDRQAYAWFGLASLDGDAIGSLDQAQLAPYLSPEDRSAAELQLTKYVRQRAAIKQELSERSQSDADHDSVPVAALAAPASVPQFTWMAEAGPIATSPMDPIGILPSRSLQEVKVKGADFGSPSFSATPRNGGIDQQMQMHEVASGETLYAIARQIQLETQASLSDVLMALRRANPTLENDRGLQTGEWLQIPVLARSLSLQ